MRVAIVILVCLSLVFVGLLLLVGTGMTFPGLDPPPMKDNTHVDENALSNWHPSVATAMARIGDVFAPHASFGVSDITVRPGANVAITAKNSGNDFDAAKITIGKAGVLLIRYVCKHADGSKCSQLACVCAAGALLTPQIAGLCKGDSQWPQNAAICPADRGKATIVVYPEARDVQLTALGLSAADASLR